MVFLLLLIDEIFEQILRVDDSLPLVEVFNILKSLHKFHLSLGVIGFVFEILHGVFLLLISLKLLEILFSLLGIFDGLVVAGSSGFYNIIMVFGVSLEGDLAIAVGAFEVESENLYAQIGLQVAYLHSHVEFGTDVQIVRASVATQTHRQHVTYHHQLV